MPAAPERRRFRQRLLTWYRRHGRDLRRRIRELGANREEIALQPDELAVDLRVRRVRPRQTEMGVQLVDVAVRGHARIVLAHARASEQRRLARIAGLCVNLHGQEA